MRPSRLEPDMTPTPAAISAKFRSAPKRVQPFATPSFPAGLCPFDINTRAFAARPHTTSRAPRRPARLLTTPHTPKSCKLSNCFPAFGGRYHRLNNLRANCVRISQSL
ncbi:hypothetical protein EDB83DRAFT_2677946 [Lactarius deliciosus]|nr:hypothetical protein EDB83DRAFT_2677946 [Lactarius deliciosus]